MNFGPKLWASCAVVLLSGDQASAAFSLDSDAPLLAKDDASADQYSGMAWLTDQCPGIRTSSQKEGLEACVRWSTGLEHESFLVHSHERNKEEYVVNVGSVANQMSRYGRAFGLDRETHSVAVYLEQTGVCLQYGPPCSPAPRVVLPQSVCRIPPRRKKIGRQNTTRTKRCGVSM